MYVGLPFLFRVIWSIDSKLPQVWNWAAHRQQSWEYLCVTFELAQLYAIIIIRVCVSLPLMLQIVELAAFFVLLNTNEDNT